MMYEGFANVYDHMMENIPYEDWFEKLHNYLKENGIDKGCVCELGCGTGIMTEKFAQAGYEMIGVDKSENMLALARMKQDESKNKILYLNQSMEDMELDRQVDAFISICDSINYLMQEQELLSMFQKVYQYLKLDGYFIFDLKTVYCYRNVIGNQTWVEQDEEVSYIWENYFYEDEDINEYMLTIFRKQEDSELYERVEESHYQRAYTLDTIQKLLAKAGFVVVASYDEDMENPIRDDSERMYIIAKK